MTSTRIIDCSIIPRILRIDIKVSVIPSYQRIIKAINIPSITANENIRKTWNTLIIIKKYSPLNQNWEVNNSFSKLYQIASSVDQTAYHWHGTAYIIVFSIGLDQYSFGTAMWVCLKVTPENGVHVKDASRIINKFSKFN